MKRSLKVILSLCMLLAVLTASFLFQSIRAKAAPATRCGWTVVPNPNQSEAQFTAVAALSAKNVWAVGYTGSYIAPEGLIEHWDGTNWNLVPIPNLGSVNYELTGITALSAHNIWAVGFTLNFNAPTLIEHWNGTAWSVVPSPFVTPQDTLYGVAAISGKNIWAVGYSYNSSTYLSTTLIEHWNGTAWTIVSSPNIESGSSYLYGVTAISANDVWAVGYYQNPAPSTLPLIEHWDGSAWSIVSAPNVSSEDNLSGIAAISANDIWAVGSSVNTDSYFQTLTEHWNGTQWSIVSSPNIPNDSLTSIAAAASNDIWAVGGTFTGPNGTSQTVIEHWNGTKWNISASPNPGSQNDLNAVATVPGTRQTWAVGFSTQNGTLTEFHC